MAEQWEYCMTNDGREVCELGRDGWELVAVVAEEYSIHGGNQRLVGRSYHLKRKKKTA